MALDTFPIILDHSYMLTPKVKHFIFKCQSTPIFQYLPGQFITIHFEKDGKILRRSYSIANVPKQNNLIELAAGFIEGGPGTELLFNLEPGERLQASGPFGRLTLKDEPNPKRFIFIATSTGITPYRAMIDELIARIEKDSNLEIVILLGIQKRNEILYNDEFTALTKKYPQISFRPCLSKENEAILANHEFAGHVQDLFPDLNLNPENDLVYLCGNPTMIDDAFKQLKEKGFPMQHIIREKYISR